MATLRGPRGTRYSLGLTETSSVRWSFLVTRLGWRRGNALTLERDERVVELVCLTRFEIESVEPILDRFRALDHDRAILGDQELTKNRLFTAEALALREASGHKLGAHRVLLEHQSEHIGGEAESGLGLWDLEV